MSAKVPLSSEQNSSLLKFLKSLMKSVFLLTIGFKIFKLTVVVSWNSYNGVSDLLKLFTLSADETMNKSS